MLVRDNLVTNLVREVSLNDSLIGCLLQRFNLAVEETICAQTAALEPPQAVLKGSRNLFDAPVLLLVQSKKPFKL